MIETWTKSHPILPKFLDPLLVQYGLVIETYQQCKKNCANTGIAQLLYERKRWTCMSEWVNVKKTFFTGLQYRFTSLSVFSLFIYFNKDQKKIVFIQLLKAHSAFCALPVWLKSLISSIIDSLVVIPWPGWLTHAGTQFLNLIEILALDRIDNHGSMTDRYVI